MLPVRFIFLGTGTSAGVPAIACSCPVCTSADPRDNRLRTAAAVQFTDPTGQPRTILIDASPDLRQQALRAGLTRCDAVLFTHNHVDHTFGLDEVRRFNAVMQRPVDIYAEPHTLDHLHRVYKHIFDRQNNVNDSFVATLVEHRLSPGEPLTLYGMRFTPLRFLHGKLPILGFRIEADGATASTPSSAASRVFPLAYCTDVSGIPPETWRHLEGLNTLVLDALREKRHPTHLTLAEAVNIADRVGAPRTYFIHMTHDLGHAETNERLPEGMSLAHDGLVLG
jgi:phosphoribosyl 1,2-cyclic phosphate phosphodiesterase